MPQITKILFKNSPIHHKLWKQPTTAKKDWPHCGVPWDRFWGRGPPPGALSLRAATQELPRETPLFGGSWSRSWEPVHTLPNTGNHPACHKTAGRLGSHLLALVAASREPLLGPLFGAAFRSRRLEAAPGAATMWRLQVPLPGSLEPFWEPFFMTL